MINQDRIKKASVFIKTGDSITLKDFGAVGNGIVDDTIAISNALTYISSGGRLFITRGTYVITSAISVVITGDVEIIGEAGVVFDATGSNVPEGNNLISIQGSQGTSYALTGNVTKGTNTIACAQTFALGDIVQLVSTDLYNFSRTTYIKGEFAEVESSDGTTIITKGSLYDSYSSATTTLKKMTMPRLRISNLVIKGNTNTIGLFLSTLRDLNVEDIFVYGCRYSCISCTKIYGGLVKNCEASDFFYNGTTTSYGLVIASCQGLTVLGGRYMGGRHGIASGGTIPVRDLVVQGATVGNSSLSPTEYSLDAHGNVENIIVRDCKISNGLTLLSLNSIVEDNDIQVLAYTTGVNIVPEISAGVITIRNNTITTFGNTKQGISVAPPSTAQSPITINKVTIENNVIRSTGTACRGIQVVANTKILTVTSLNISNNDISSTTECILTQINSSDLVVIKNNHLNCTVSIACISITSDSLANPFLITKLDIIDNYLVSAARCISIGSASSSTSFTISRLLLQNNDSTAVIQNIFIYMTSTNPVACNKFTILGGYYSSANNTPAFINFSTSPGIAPTIVVSESSFATITSTAQYGFNLLGGGNAYIEKNQFTGPSGNSYNCIFQCSGQLNLSRNTFTNFSNASGITFSGLGSGIQPSLALVEGNQFVSCAGVIDSGAVHTGSLITQAGTIISYASAIPTSGTWKLGDVVFSTVPTTSLSFWICTAAGTPGTWVANGSLGSGGSSAPTLVTTLPAPVAGLRGNSVTLMGITGTPEVASLTVTAIVTTNGNVTVTLNGIVFNIPVLTTDNTTTLVATKIRAFTFPYHTTGGSGAVVTFTANTPSNTPDATYSAGSTGATGNMTTTTQGTTSTADTKFTCTKLANDTYDWIQ